MSKYAALRDYLMSLKHDHWQASFEEVESVLGAPLPQSARRYPAWWANQNPQSHVQCSGWLDAGWRTANLNISAERVTFLRSGITSDDVNLPTHKPTKSSLEWDDVLQPDGREQSSLNVIFSWRKLGNVYIDEKHRLSFPRVPIGPAVYKFALNRRGNVEIYIGETDEVSRCFQHYRTPGLTQRTNQRLNAAMKDCLGNEGDVEISIIENACVEWAEIKRALNLSEKLERRLLEHTAIIGVWFADENVINL